MTIVMVYHDIDNLIFEESNVISMNDKIQDLGESGVLKPDVNKLVIDEIDIDKYFIIK